MIREMCYYGNPILRTRCQEVTDFGPETQAIIQDLVDTANCYACLGLAAPQIGYNVRIFLVTYTELDEDNYPLQSDKPKLYINPKIVVLDERTWVHNEGCLSLPNIQVEVERPWKIRIEAQDPDGKAFVEEHEGWMARPLIHENDHLNGVLTIDRTSKQERKEVTPALKRIKKRTALKKS